jgi:DNA replication and repair protein RecF
MRMQTDLSGLSQEQLRQGFRQRLEALRREEIARGVTTIGPHRDELRILRMQLTWAILARAARYVRLCWRLKLAEVSWLQEKTGHWPVLLLDEIMAELDLQRRADLLVDPARLRAGHADNHRSESFLLISSPPARSGR